MSFAIGGMLIEHQLDRCQAPLHSENDQSSQGVVCPRPGPDRREIYVGVDDKKHSDESK